jgi:hypothetical protein
VGSNILHDLEEKAKSVPWERNSRKVWYILFSAEGFTDDLKVLASERDDVLLFDDMENCYND